MNDMQAKLQTLWDDMLKAVDCDKKRDKNIIVHRERADEFNRTFHELYSKTMKQNMAQDVIFLDRHKVAAIIILSIIKSEILEYRDVTDNKVFLGNYHLALSTGLSYMQYELNQVLREKGESIIKKYDFPDVMHGKSSYKENLINMLYFSDKEENLSVLSLANIMFMIETYNLLRRDEKE